MAKQTKVLYTDKCTFLKTSRDRSSVMPAALAAFFMVGTLLVSILWQDPLMTIVGVVGLTANLLMLYLVRRNEVGSFEVREDGIRFPKPRDAFVEFDRIRKVRTMDQRTNWIFRTRYIEIVDLDGARYVISDRRIPGTDYVTGDYGKVERAISERFNELDR
jgi:hypothetical protein